jgi:Metal binding domain of Ada
VSYTLIGRDGRPYGSREPGALGGNRRTKVYGLLDCPVALSLLARGHHPAHGVFFADEGTAIAAGYRPCGACLRRRYSEWKAGALHPADP